MKGTPVITVLPSALKHGLTTAEVEYAWRNVFEFQRTKGDKMPPHYKALGVLPNGKAAELIAFSTSVEWFVFHAMSPVRQGFMKGASK